MENNWTVTLPTERFLELLEKEKLIIEEMVWIKFNDNSFSNYVYIKTTDKKMVSKVEKTLNNYLSCIDDNLIKPIKRENENYKDQLKTLLIYQKKMEQENTSLKNNEASLNNKIQQLEEEVLRLQKWKYFLFK